MRSAPIAAVLLALLVAVAPLPGRGKNRPVPDSPEVIDPLSREALDFLGVDRAAHDRAASLALQKKDYRRAAQEYLFLLHHRPDDSTSLYNLACCYSRLGDAHLAARALALAARKGLVRASLLESDPDFEPVSRDPEFAAVRENLLRAGRSLGRLTWVEAPLLLPCRIQMPKNYNPLQRYPLLIGLHGYGDNSDSFSTLWADMGDPPLIFASLEAPYPAPAGLNLEQPGFSWGLVTPETYFWKRSDQLIVEAVGETIRQIGRQHPIGDVYLLGHSQGGSYAFLAGLRLADRVRGLVVFAGPFPQEELEPADIARASSLRVLLAHGRSDPAVPFDRSQATRELLARAGCPVTLLPFDGGHAIPEKPLREAVAWILKK